METGTTRARRTLEGDTTAARSDAAVVWANLLGTPVSSVDMNTAITLIDEWIDADQRVYVCICTVHTLMEARRSREMRDAVAGASMNTPDGMPLVWLLRRRGHRRTAQVCGPELLPTYVSTSRARSRRHFFYGGGEGVAEELASQLRARFPGAEVVGAVAPPFGSVEELCTQAAADEINATDPDVIWIGLSTPKQDLWMARMRPRLTAPVLIGVGAAFDFNAGTLKRSPRWMSNLGFEWLYRLYREPRRLWRRYLVNNSAFLWAVLNDLFSPEDSHRR